MRASPHWPHSGSHGVSGESIETTQNDYGFSLTARRGLRLDEDAPHGASPAKTLLDDLIACMNTAELARRQFREIARVSGLILQPAAGRPSRPPRELQSVRIAAVRGAATLRSRQPAA